MIFNRNRKDGNPDIANRADIYLNGLKQEKCIEARTVGPFLKGLGYVIRQIDGESNQSYYGIPVEKVYGFVEVRIS